MNVDQVNHDDNEDSDVIVTSANPLQNNDSTIIEGHEEARDIISTIINSNLLTSLKKTIDIEILN